MESIKKNWKNIVIILLVLFGMNQCASRCTNKSKYEKTQYVADSLSTVVNKLERDTAELNHKIAMYEGFNTQMNENIRQQNVKDSIHAANQEKLTKQNQTLINKIRRNK